MGIAMSNTELTTCLTLLSSELPDEIRDGAHRAGDGRFTEAIPSLVRHVASSNIGVQEAADRALRRIGGQRWLRRLYLYYVQKTSRNETWGWTSYVVKGLLILRPLPPF